MQDGLWVDMVLESTLQLSCTVYGPSFGLSGQTVMNRQQQVWIMLLYCSEDLWQCRLCCIMSTQDMCTMDLLQKCRGSKLWLNIRYQSVILAFVYHHCSCELHQEHKFERWPVMLCRSYTILQNTPSLNSEACQCVASWSAVWNSKVVSGLASILWRNLSHCFRSKHKYFMHVAVFESSTLLTYVVGDLLMVVSEAHQDARSVRWGDIR